MEFQLVLQYGSTEGTPSGPANSYLASGIWLKLLFRRWGQGKACIYHSIYLSFDILSIYYHISGWECAWLIIVKPVPSDDRDCLHIFAIIRSQEFGYVPFHFQCMSSQTPNNPQEANHTARCPCKQLSQRI